MKDNYHCTKRLTSNYSDNNIKYHGITHVKGAATPSKVLRYLTLPCQFLIEYSPSAAKGCDLLHNDKAKRHGRDTPRIDHRNAMDVAVYHMAITRSAICIKEGRNDHLGQRSCPTG